MKKIWMLVISGGMIISWLTFAFAQEDKQSSSAEIRNGFRDISGQELKKMIDSGGDFVLVDVHIPEQKHLQRTDEFIPFDSLSQNQDKFPPDKQKKIVVFCRSGSMSAKASAELAGLGYVNVYNVQEGMNGWKNSGYPVDGPDRIVYLKASRFSFSPDIIRVKQGEKIRIIAESQDVRHGFALAEFNLKEAIDPGEKKKIEFIAEKKGEFIFHCFIYCGEGHAGMEGKLLVE